MPMSRRCLSVHVACRSPVPVVWIVRAVSVPPWAVCCPQRHGHRSLLGAVRPFGAGLVGEQCGRRCVENDSVVAQCRLGRDLAIEDVVENELRVPGEGVTVAAAARCHLSVPVAGTDSAVWFGRKQFLVTGTEIEDVC